MFDNILVFLDSLRWLKIKCKYPLLLRCCIEILIFILIFLVLLVILLFANQWEPFCLIIHRVLHISDLREVQMPLSHILLFG